MKPATFAPGKVQQILVACIGNMFMGDDGFGVEFARHILRREARPFAEQIRVIDFGIRGFDLAYELLEDYDVLILVDAVQRGGAPGTLYLLEPDLTNMTPEAGCAAASVGLDAHSMDPVKVLAYARTLGARPIPTFLLGCEPAVLSENADYLDLHLGLSEPVQAALPRAAHMLDSLLTRLLSLAEPG